MKCNILTKDIEQKLHGCIIRYKGHPYYATFYGGDQMKLYNVGKNQNESYKYTVSIYDDEFDISSVPLGYVNGDHKDYMYVSYVTRNPIRKVRQGICTTNLNLDYLPNSPFRGIARLDHTFRSKGFEDTITGSFMPLGNALKTLRSPFKDTEQKYREIAISREIALTIDELGLIKVYFKNTYVGWIAPNEFIVHVPSDNGKAWVVSRYLSHILGWTID